MARFHRAFPAPLRPDGKDYTYYKSAVRNDFEGCCAHCLRHEDHWGGPEHSELDHFRPQKPFLDLIDDFHNLYYSCHRCNQRKSNTWPKEHEERAGEYFVDLCRDDFETHYILHADGHLEPLTEAAKYTIKKIKLNSAELIRERANILRDGHALDQSKWPAE